MAAKSKLRILIVDDEQRWLAIVKEAGSDSSRIVDIADSGEMALRKIRKNDYDLILSDVRMPGMNGFDLFEKIKSDRAMSDVPYVFMSSLDDFDARETARRLGADDYVEKPFDAATVKDILDALIARYGSKSRVRVATTRQATALLQADTTEEVRPVPPPKMPADAPISVRGDAVDDVIVIKCDGNMLTFVDAGGLSDMVKPDIRMKHRKFVLDINGVEFATTTGLASLLRLSEEIEKAKAEIVFINVGPKLQKLLEITQLDRVLRILPSLEEAIGHLRSGATSDRTNA